jgi:hypothetical protein
MFSQNSAVASAKKVLYDVKIPTGRNTVFCIDKRYWHRTKTLQCLLQADKVKAKCSGKISGLKNNKESNRHVNLYWYIGQLIHYN